MIVYITPFESSFSKAPYALAADVVPAQNRRWIMQQRSACGIENIRYKIIRTQL
jgi:hypothetical protein